MFTCLWCESLRVNIDNARFVIFSSESKKAPMSCWPLVGPARLLEPACILILRLIWWWPMLILYIFTIATTATTNYQTHIWSFSKPYRYRLHILLEGILVSQSLNSYRHFDILKCFTSIALVLIVGGRLTCISVEVFMLGYTTCWSKMTLIVNGKQIESLVMHFSILRCWGSHR